MGRTAAAETIEVDQAQQDAWERMIDAGRRSPDLRVRIVHSVGAIERRGDAHVLGESIPVGTLVEQARGSTDPIVLSLMVDRCFDHLRQAGDCDAVDFARRWTSVDTQNELAWIALSTTLSNSGDVESARVAFRRASQASQWHEYSSDVARLLEGSVEKASGVSLRWAMLIAVVMKAWVVKTLSAEALAHRAASPAKIPAGNDRADR